MNQKTSVLNTLKKPVQIICLSLLCTQAWGLADAVRIDRSPVRAIAPQVCPDRVAYIGKTQVQQLETKEKDSCLLSLYNSETYSDLIYRDYLVSSSGSLMIFISLGEGPEESKNGAKEFFFFPRNVKSQSFEGIENDTKLQVNSRFAFDFTFDATSSELLSMTNANVKVSPKISPDNEAGVVIEPTKGLIYELPFTLGGAPSGDLTLSGVFKDAQGHQCTVANSALFKSIGDGDTRFKYTDAQLKMLLAKICPQIQF